MKCLRCNKEVPVVFLVKTKKTTFLQELLFGQKPEEYCFNCIKEIMEG